VNIGDSVASQDGALKVTLAAFNPKTESLRHRNTSAVVDLVEEAINLL
jgi:hypothetical protein